MKPHRGSSALLQFVLCFAVLVLPSNESSSQWIQQASGTPEILLDVVVLDSSTAIVVGHRNAILRTTDAGTTWVNENAAISAAYDWNCISFHGTSEGAIVGDHRVVTTKDGGITWTLRSPPSSQRCLSVFAAGDGVLYVGSDSGWISRSADTGKAWTSTKISSWPIQSIFTYPGPTVPGAPVYFALTPYTLCTSAVFPLNSWNETAVPVFKGLGSEAFSSQFCQGGGAQFVVGVIGDLWSEAAIFRKRSGDTVWQAVTLSPIASGIFTDVAAPSRRVCYACGTSGMIYASSDSGTTWTKSLSPTTHALYAIAFFDEKIGFAVGDSGTILYTKNGIVTQVRISGGNGPREFYLDRVYPNPFNPATLIRYHLASKEIVVLTIHDVLGRKVATLVNKIEDAGYHEALWNAGNSPSGIYFCSLRAGAFLRTGKLVLLK